MGRTPREEMMEAAQDDRCCRQLGEGNLPLPEEVAKQQNFESTGQHCRCTKSVRRSCQPLDRGRPSGANQQVRHYLRFVNNHLITIDPGVSQHLNSLAPRAMTRSTPQEWEYSRGQEDREDWQPWLVARATPEVPDHDEEGPGRARDKAKDQGSPKSGCLGRKPEVLD